MKVRDISNFFSLSLFHWFPISSGSVNLGCLNSVREFDCVYVCVCVCVIVLKSVCLCVFVCILAFVSFCAWIDV